MWYVGLILIIASSIYVCVKCYSRPIVPAIFLSIVFVAVYGFASFAIRFVFDNSPVVLFLISLVLGLVGPFVLYASDYRPENRSDEKSTELTQTIVEKLEIKGPKSWNHFWDDPKYSYVQGKVIILIVVIIGTIIYNVFQWVSGIF